MLFCFDSKPIINGSRFVGTEYIYRFVFDTEQFLDERFSDDEQYQRMNDAILNEVNNFCDDYFAKDLFAGFNKLEIFGDGQQGLALDFSYPKTTALFRSEVNFFQPGFLN